MIILISELCEISDEYSYILETGTYDISSFYFSGNVPSTVYVSYEGNSNDWDGFDIDYNFEGCDEAVIYAGDGQYKSYNSSAAEWISWDSGTLPAEPTPEPEPTPIEPTTDDPTDDPTPATGVEANIGFAIASLALVGAMFVVVRRKEER